LDQTTEKKLINTLLQEYIENHAATLLNMENSGLVHMIKNDKTDEICLMYELFSKVVPAFNQLKQHMQTFIITEGNKLVNDDKLKHDEYVTKIIDLREKMLNILLKSFNKDSQIDITIKNSFENFIN
jgi:cullin 3